MAKPASKTHTHRSNLLTLPDYDRDSVDDDIDPFDKQYLMHLRDQIYLIDYTASIADHFGLAFTSVWNRIDEPSRQCMLRYWRTSENAIFTPRAPFIAVLPEWKTEDVCVVEICRDGHVMKFLHAALVEMPDEVLNACIAKTLGLAYLYACDENDPKFGGFTERCNVVMEAVAVLRAQDWGLQPELFDAWMYSNSMKVLRILCSIASGEKSILKS